MGKNVFWGNMSWGKLTFGEKRRSQINYLKKWGNMSFGEKCRREKCYREKCHLGKNVLHPSSYVVSLFFLFLHEHTHEIMDNKSSFKVSKIS